ncbi:hypothetical protein GH714_038286 [Hevea brasiliensis]|uniref:Uncharacterized protein n=1 Tax=Hevea brasiliensis TaxID=3981 RepID=A0A6A6LIZ0_HEVBR|nr:hypothetical protein GH714_038286 [Hevea brasiliensis]
MEASLEKSDIAPAEEQMVMKSNGDEEGLVLEPASKFELDSSVTKKNPSSEHGFDDEEPKEEEATETWTKQNVEDNDKRR